MFPVVEGKKRKPIYHCGLIAHPKTVEAFQKRGWEPIDLRLQESGPETLKNWLEGIRFGTIEANRQTEKFVELELKAYGVLANRKQEEKKKDDTIADLDDMFASLPAHYTNPKRTKGKKDK
jgi:hypothetical protein